MRYFKQITILSLALTLGCFSVQADSIFTQFLNGIKEKGGKILGEVATKAQESLENGRLFGLPNCTKTTVRNALEYAIIVEASSYNDSGDEIGRAHV